MTIGICTNCAQRHVELEEGICLSCLAEKWRPITQESNPVSKAELLAMCKRAVQLLKGAGANIDENEPILRTIAKAEDRQ